MWNNIRNWFSSNEMQITWFIIGSFTTWFIVDIGNHNLLGAAIDAFVVAINCALRPR